MIPLTGTNQTSGFSASRLGRDHRGSSGTISKSRMISRGLAAPALVRRRRVRKCASSRRCLVWREAAREPHDLSRQGAPFGWSDLSSNESERADRHAPEPRLKPTNHVLSRAIRGMYSLHTSALDGLTPLRLVP